MQHARPDKQTICPADFSLCFLAGLLGVKGSGQKTADPSGVSVEDMISMTLPLGAIGAPQIELARQGSAFEPVAIRRAEVFDGGKAIIKIGKRTQCFWLRRINFVADGLVFLFGLFDVRGGKSVHFGEEGICGRGQFDHPCVKRPPVTFRAGL